MVNPFSPAPFLLYFTKILSIITMKIKLSHLPLYFTILILAILSMAGCSFSAKDSESESGDLDITQAYQTVDAKLTQAVAATPLPPTQTNPPAPATATPTPDGGTEPGQPTASGTPAGATATFLPTLTHTPASRCDIAGAAYPSIDITIPDDTEIPAGNIFTKVWRVVNMGTCNWTAEYAAVFFSGEQMKAEEAVYISQPVAPGQNLDIEVDMVAPLEPGTYQGNWMLRNADGDLFGIGPNGNDSFWVRIVVVEAEDTPTPTASPVPEPEILVRGGATLNIGEGLDLDTLLVNGSTADVAYQQISSGGAISGHYLVPLTGVAMGIFGDVEPTYGNCQAANKGSANIDLEAIASGTYFCYTTNQALIGWGRFDGLDAGNGVVTLAILTWAPLDE
jgi:hypothetical protein